MPTFVIAGKPHELQCGIKEHEAIFQITGKNVFAGENPITAIGSSNLTQILHLMLTPKAPTLTKDEVEAELDSTRKMVQALRAITETFNDGLEDAVKAEENPSPAA